MKPFAMKKYGLTAVLLFCLLLLCGCAHPKEIEDVPSVPPYDVSHVTAASSSVSVAESSETAESVVSAVSKVSDVTESHEVSDVTESHEVSDVTESHEVSETASPQQSDVSAESSVESESSEEKSAESSAEQHPSAVASAPESSAENSKKSSEVSSSDPDAEIAVIEKLDKKYFVSRLDRPSLRNFARLYANAAQSEEKARFDHEIPSEQLDTLMFLLNYDCPELIHLSGDYIPLYSDEAGEYVNGVRFIYYMEPYQYHECSAELEDFKEKLLKETDGMSPLEIEQYVYQMLFDTVVFDDYSSHAGSIYGALIEHRARCEGISKAFAWCLQCCGIECMSMAGTPLWENTGAYAGHSWNIVHLEDEYYHVDVAAENLRSYEGENVVPLYGFLNSSDAQMERTHVVNDIFRQLGVPSCPSDRLNYHVSHGLYIDSGEDMKNRFDTILSEHYADGERTQISIRLNSEEAYRQFIDNWEEWLFEFRLDQSYTFYTDCTAYYNEVSLTTVIVIYPAESTPEELLD